MSNFLLGFGIGLTVGVLFAPKPGSETRQLISDKASSGTDYLMRQSQQLRDSASDLVEKGRNILSDQKDRFAGAAQGAQQGAEQGYRS